MKIRHLAAITFFLLLPLALSACAETPTTQPSESIAEIGATNSFTATLEWATNTAQAPEVTEIPPEIITPLFKPSPITRTPSPTATQLPAARIPILEYHHPSYASGNSQMTAEWFIEQLDWLKDNGFVTLTGDQLASFIDGIEPRPPQKSVVLRFDAGLPRYTEFATIVIPALRERGFHGIIFVLVDAISDDCSHSTDAICWNDLVDWEKEGVITVGSHGVFHPDYKKIEESEILWDARVSGQVLEEKLGHPTVWFTYPYDSVPEKAATLIKAAGFRYAVAGDRGWDRSVRFADPEPYNLPSYYPYSSPQSYPILTTAYPPVTFPELMLQAISIP